MSKGNNDPATASGTRTGPVKEKVRVIISVVYVIPGEVK